LRLRLLSREIRAGYTEPAEGWDRSSDTPSAALSLGAVMKAQTYAGCVEPTNFNRYLTARTKPFRAVSG
jgi:hypothetical protein